MAKVYNAPARKRINRAVKWVETRVRNRDGQRRRRGGPNQLSSFFIAQEDIEHDFFGDAILATAASMDSNYTTFNSQIVEIFNPGPKIWSGSRMILERVSLAGSDQREDAVKWVVRQAWSATSIRGIASGTIASGGSGTITSVVPANGHFNSTTATVHVPAGVSSIDNGSVVCADLVYTGSSSRWEVCSVTGGGGAVLEPFHTNTFYGPRYYYSTGPNVGDEIPLYTDPGMFTDPERTIFWWHSDLQGQNIGFDNRLGPDIGIEHDTGESIGNQIRLTQPGVYRFVLSHMIQPYRVFSASRPDPPIDIPINGFIFTGSGEIQSSTYVDDGSIFRQWYLSEWHEAYNSASPGTEQQGFFQIEHFERTFDVRFEPPVKSSVAILYGLDASALAFATGQDQQPDDYGYRLINPVLTITKMSDREW